MKYTFIFLVLAVMSGVAARLGWEVVGCPALALLWPGLSFLLLAVAYAGIGPGLFMKRNDGRRVAWSWFLFGPYFVLNAILFEAYRRLSPEPAFAEVAPNLFFGRALTSREAAQTNWLSVLDLACEFAEVRPLRDREGYRSLPLLDDMAPTTKQLQEAVDWIAGAVERGPVYVHCALGHGRSACVVLAYLFSARHVASVKDGFRLLRSARPSVRLNLKQRQRLREVESAACAE